MVVGYFAYGSNMNPARMRERGMRFSQALGARLEGLRLVFDKASKVDFGADAAASQQIGHANVVYDPGGVVEGVVYHLVDAAEILRMDPFECAPVNYSREVVQPRGHTSCWIYFANPGVRRSGLRPSRSYLNHLLEARGFLSSDYYQMLQQIDAVEDE